jgi:tetratricopeptide (TPR) repeat protein
VNNHRAWGNKTSTGLPAVVLVRVLARVLVPLLTTGLLLAGCGAAARRGDAAMGPAAATPVTPVTPARPAMPAMPTAADNPALTRFEAQQREAADTATRLGRWADVMWALDVLQALHPNDNALAQRRVQAEQSAAAAAAQRLRQAKAAQQRGDADTAVSLYLEVLALQTQDSEAAEALRALERERVTRQHLGLSARNTLARAATAEPVGVKNQTAGDGGRNELEHASLLASQGEVAAAIAMLSTTGGPNSNQPATRRLLADLYLQQADALWPQRGAEAIAAAERGLLANPSHKGLRERLKQWREPAAGIPEGKR